MPMMWRSSRAGLRKWAILSLTWLAVLALIPMPDVRGQDAAKPDAPKAGAPKAEAPKAAASAVDPTEAHAPKSMLRWALEASGPIGVFFLCPSLYSAPLAIRLVPDFRLPQ